MGATDDNDPFVFYENIDVNPTTTRRMKKTFWNAFKQIFKGLRS